MARTSSSDAAKAAATAANPATATPAQQTPVENTPAPAVVAGTQDAGVVTGSDAGGGAGPVEPIDPANGIGSTAQAGPASADTGGTVPDAATAGTATISLDAKAGTGDQVQADVDSADKGEITIYPLRSYLDGKEVRRAGGAGYKSPKHDAVSLIAAGLATDKKPKA